MNFRIKELYKEKKLLFKNLTRMIRAMDVGSRQSLGSNPAIGTLEKIASALDASVPELFDTPKEEVITCPHCRKAIASKME